jgi:hypothetical protein
MRGTDEDCRRIILASSLTDLRVPEAQDQDQKSLSFADGCPFRNIRKIVPVEEEDGADCKGVTDTLIGDITMHRHPFFDIPHDRNDEKTQACEKNDALPPGHPELIWTVGCAYIPIPYPPIPYPP